MNTKRVTFLLSGYRWIITGIVLGLIFYLFFGAVIPQLFDEPNLGQSIVLQIIISMVIGYLSLLACFNVRDRFH